MKTNLLKFLVICFLVLFSSSINSQIDVNQPQLHQKISYKNPQQIKLSVNSFELNRLKPIQFKSFTFSDFKLDKSGIVKLKNGKVIPAEKFLNEVNEIEKKLNEFGYSLRSQENEILFGRLKYPYEHLHKQSSLLNESAKHFSKEGLRITPCGTITEKEIRSALSDGTPKESWPIKKDKNWSVDLGNNDFGVGINSKSKFETEEKNSLISINSDTDFEIKLKILHEEIPAVKLIDRVFNLPSQNNIILFLLNNKAIQENLNTSAKKKYFRDLDWESEIEFSLGPFSVDGFIRTNGQVGMIKNFNPSNNKYSEELFPFIDLDFSGELNTDLEIAEAGFEGKVKIINDTIQISRNVDLIGNDSEKYLDYSFNITNNLIALKGKIFAYIKVDYLFGSKKFILVLYDNPDGVLLKQNILKENLLQPARRDRDLWLEISRINGITNYTARNEKIDVSPKSFIVELDAAGQSFCDTILDWNKDGILETPVRFKIPMLSSLSIPIKISVLEKYKIGDFDFDTYLDLVKGESRDINICYNPLSRKIFGDVSGDEQQELVSTGDRNYYGERYHSVKFKLTPALKFKPAQEKVK